MTGGKLPNGKTCSDCVFSSKCSWLIGIKGTETECDWLPSKFVQRTEVTDGISKENDS